jgi:uncharacterized protein YlzI (FlbEa/FlbD family)
MLVLTHVDSGRNIAVSPASIESVEAGYEIGDDPGSVVRTVTGRVITVSESFETIINRLGNLK